MAFQFPDPNVTPEFEGDNGITYAWDPVDEKWTIKGFSADLDDRYVNREGGDDMEGPLEITGGSAHLNLKNGSQIQSSGTEIITMGGSGGFYRGVINNADHLVNKEYVDDQIDEVVGLLGGIGSSNKAGIFTWQASGAITPGGWQFEGRTNPDYEYAGLNKINISKSDKAGNTWSVDDFPINEVLRIEDESDGHFLEGHITAVVDGGPASIQVSYTIDEANGTADGDQVISVGENLDHRYVERTGDSMTGQLLMDGANVKLAPGNIRFQPITPASDQGADAPGRWNYIGTERLRDEDGNLLNQSGNIHNFGIRFDLTQGRTGYNTLEYYSNEPNGNPNSPFCRFSGGNYPNFKWLRGQFSMEDHRILKVADAETDTDAVPYGQVKQELIDLRDSLVEELAFGTWVYSSNNVTPIQTRFYVRASNGNTTNVQPALVNTLLFNVQDLNGALPPFDRVDQGELITLSSGGIVAKYRVSGPATNSGSQNEGRVIPVSFVSQSETFSFTEGLTWNVRLTEFADGIDFGDLDDTYVRLDAANNPITDELEITHSPNPSSDFGTGSLHLKGRRTSAGVTAGQIKFTNIADETNPGSIEFDSLSGNGGFKFNRNVNLEDNDITAGNFRLNTTGSLYAGATARITLKESAGSGNGNGLIQVERPGTNGKRGFTIRGKDTSNADADILFSYTNSSGGDSIDYIGRQTANTNHIATTKYVKEYVDNNVTSSPGTDLSNVKTTLKVTIQSSTGNNTDIAGAVAGVSAGMMTAADKQHLDDLDCKIRFENGSFFISRR